MNKIKTERQKLRAKRVFLTKGACSHTFFYILNREYGYPKEHEERALDPLAGGILQHGYQCGMLWGASMAVGAESYRRNKNDIGKAMAVAVEATKHIMKSFENQTKCIECEDFTKTDFKNKWSFAKYMFSGKFYSCFKLAEKWAPEAIKAAEEGLNINPEYSLEPLICTSELVKKMGGTDEEMVMVAGFAGGLGLSGSGCGALSASIWKTILELVKNDKWKSKLNDPDSEEIIKRFFEATDFKMECHEICGKHFKSIDEHTEYIKSGGCKNILDALSRN